MSYVLRTDGNTIIFDVTHVAGCDYYRFFLRYTEDTTGSNMLLYQYDVESSTDFSITYDGEAGRSYTGNVYYRASIEDSWKIMGAQTVQIDSRPDDWFWTTVIATGYSVQKYGESLAPITADEWNAFCERINEFREYKSLSARSFTTVNRGTQMNAAIIRQAVSAISSISGSGALPTIYNVTSAAFWHQLADALNAIP